MIARFRYDTTELFTLSGGGSGNDSVCINVYYFPTTPKIDMSITDEIDRWEKSRATEPIEVLLRGTSAEIIAAVNELENIFRRSERNATSITDSSVYLEYQSYASADVYRSRVITGRVEWSDEPALRRLPDSGDTTVKIYIFITRVGYWEAPEVELHLANTASSGVYVTGGRTIYNYDGDTTGHDNWVKTSSTYVEGILPAPVRIKLKNNSGSTQTYKHFHIGVIANANASMTHNIDGEDAVSGSDGTNTVVAGGSAYVRRLTNVGTTVRKVGFLLDYGAMQDTGGRFFRILGNFPASGTGVYAKLTLRYGGISGSQLAETGEVLLSGTYEVKDLGLLPLPPGGYEGASEDIYLVVELRADSTQTVDLDFLNLFACDSYRYITQVGESLASNDSVFDDQINYPVQVYTQVYSTTRNKKLFSYIGRTYLWPNRDNKITFLWDGSSITLVSTLNVSAWYRPRYITV